MRLFSFILFIALITPTAFGQSRASRCYFGNCILNFDYTPFQVEILNLESCGESPASICDENGQLLFYSNGGPHGLNPGGIWSHNTQFMENGAIMDSAGCRSSYAGASAIPVPNVNRNNNGQYYLFTKDCIESSFMGDHYNAGVTVSLIDMTANGGLGTVVSKYTTVVPYEIVSAHTTNAEPIALINHSNGYDYWLFSYTKDSVCRVAVTSGGIGAPEKLFPGGGIIVFSPAANFVVFGSKLYSFDATSGDLTFVGTVPFNPGLSTVAFSSDGHYLYMLNNQILTQFDCTASDIFSSGYTVSNNVGGTAGTIFLAANTRIFICSGNKTYLEAQIICPNNGGAACGFDGTDLPLNGGYTGSNTFTNIPANFLFNETGSCSVGITEEELNDLSLKTTEEAFTVTSKSATHLEVNVLDLQGKVIASVNGNDELTIDRSSLNSGAYFLEVRSASTRKTTQFLVVNY